MSTDASLKQRTVEKLDPHGLVFALQFDAEGVASILPDVPNALPRKGPGWIWVHLDLVDRRSLHWLQQHGRLDEVMLQAFTGEDTRPHVEHAEDEVCGAFAEMTSEPQLQSARGRLLRFGLGPHYLVTGRHHPLHDVEVLREKLLRGTAATHPAHLLQDLIDASLTRFQKEVNGMVQQVNRIEDHVIEHGGTTHNAEIAALRRKSVAIQRELNLAKPMIRQFADAAQALDFPESLARATEAACHRVDALQNEVHTLQDRARLIKDEISANLANDMNRSLYIISVISALLLPPSLIFGLFGINVGGLPLVNNDLGFLSVIGVGLLSSAVVYLLLRRRA